MLEQTDSAMHLGEKFASRWGWAAWVCSAVILAFALAELAGVCSFSADPLPDESKHPVASHD